MRSSRVARPKRRARAKSKARSQVRRRRSRSLERPRMGRNVSAAAGAALCHRDSKQILFHEHAYGCIFQCGSQVSKRPQPPGGPPAASAAGAGVPTAEVSPRGTPFLTAASSSRRAPAPKGPDLDPVPFAFGGPHPLAPSPAPPPALPGRGGTPTKGPTEKQPDRFGYVPPLPGRVVGRGGRGGQGVRALSSHATSRARRA